MAREKAWGCRQHGFRVHYDRAGHPGGPLPPTFLEFLIVFSFGEVPMFKACGANFISRLAQAPPGLHKWIYAGL